MHVGKRILSLLMAVLLIGGMTVYGADSDLEKQTMMAQAQAEAMEALARRLGMEDTPSEEDIVSIIVELEEPGNISVSEIGGGSYQDDRDAVKAQIRALSGAAAETIGGGRLFDGPDPVTFGYDYHWVMQGFSLEAPFGYLEKIRAIDGVRNAYVASTYYLLDDAGASDASYENEVSQAMAGVDEANAMGFTGKGMVIAVIDSGLDLGHEAFSGPVSDPRLGIEDIDSVIPRLNAEINTGTDVYYSEKIPFQYDYSNQDTDVTPANLDKGHGTHVSGIAVANGGAIRGVAPDAQLVFMNVFPEEGEAKDQDLIAALDDAAALNVDVINLSLGSDGEFSSYATKTEQRIYENLRNLGITVVAAAGNSAYAGSDYPSGGQQSYVGYPDKGTVDKPSSYFDNLSVSSLSAAVCSILRVGGETVTFLEGNSDNTVIPKAADLSGQMPCLDCGLGTPEEIDAAITGSGREDLSGCAALIQRGSLTFAEKAQNAADRNASAVIIYNNVYNTTLVQMALNGFDACPAMFISREDGEFILGREEKVISFEGETRETRGTPDSFSSWGPTPEMHLKPDVAAAGGAVYSAIPGGSYGTKSGTSMSSPQMAGLTALLKEYIGQNQVFGNLDRADQDQMARTLLMNTACPVTASGGTVWYSPLKQGAGLANAAKAMSANAYVTVNDSYDGLPKAELGDGTGPWSFTLTLHSLSRQPCTFTLDTAALCQDLDGEYYRDTSTNYTGKGVKVSYQGVRNGSVTVPAGGEAEITVTITAERSLIDRMKSAENGFFLDGFVRFLTGESGGADLTVPFLAFYGQWSDQQILDKTGENAYMADTYVSNLTDTARLGANPFEKDDQGTVCVDPDKAAISPNSVYGYFGGLRTHTSLLRNADQMQITVSRRENGKTVCSKQGERLPKTCWKSDAEKSFAVYPEMNFDSAISAGYRKFQEGGHTCTVSVKRFGRTESYSFRFAFDPEPPELTYQVTGRAGNQKLVISASDREALSGVLVYPQGTAASEDPNDEMLYTDVGMKEGRYEEAVLDGEGATITISLDELIRQYRAEGKEMQYIYLEAYDYALNVSRDIVLLEDQLNPDTLRLDPTQLTMHVGETENLTPSWMPDWGQEEQVFWSSDDASVAEVDGTGRVTAVGVGRTRIRGSVQGGPGMDSPSAECLVRVLFDDVEPDQWSLSDITFVSDGGLMIGTSPSEFGPEEEITRAMLVTILYRLEGEPECSGSNPFRDVKPGSYYDDPTVWASQQEIVKGYGDGLFGPEDPVTREQLVTILYRYFQYKGRDVSKRSGILGFLDGDQASEYAVPALEWAYANGVLQGSRGGLTPLAYATREQAAAILHRTFGTGETG